MKNPEEMVKRAHEIIKEQLKLFEGVVFNALTRQLFANNVRIAFEKEGIDLLFIDGTPAEKEEAGNIEQNGLSLIH